jgi:hypothetical protein
VAANSPVHALVADIIERHNVRTVFQPLVHVESLAVVGFEALTRGPEGSPLEAPISRASGCACRLFLSRWQQARAGGSGGYRSQA